MILFGTMAMVDQLFYEKRQIAQ